MAERPILFSGAMLRALLDGKKTQTRRIVDMRGIGHIGPAGSENDPASWGYAFEGPRRHGWRVLARGLDESRDHGLVSIRCPHGEPGDRLWVREAFARGDFLDDDLRPLNVVYKADAGGFADPPPKYKHGIHMPRAYSRITLEILSLRVERLQEITEADAKAEGVMPHHHLWWGWKSLWKSAPAAFANLWNHDVNDKRVLWTSNPWVWVIEFKQVRP